MSTQGWACTSERDGWLIFPLGKTGVSWSWERVPNRWLHCISTSPAWFTVQAAIFYSGSCSVFNLNLFQVTWKIGFLQEETFSLNLVLALSLSIDLHIWETRQDCPNTVSLAGWKKKKIGIKAQCRGQNGNTVGWALALHMADLCSILAQIQSPELCHWAIPECRARKKSWASLSEPHHTHQKQLKTQCSWVDAKSYPWTTDPGW